MESCWNALWGFVVPLAVACQQEKTDVSDKRQPQLPIAAPASAKVVPSEGAATHAAQPQPQLFGVNLATATRERLREALAAKGLTPKRSDPRSDTYDSTTLLDESSTLDISFTSKGTLARATYTFPSRLDTEQVTRIRDLVQKKYGPPSEAQGNVQVGGAAFVWQLAEGISARVSRGWPDTTTTLEYTHAENAARLDAELGADRARQEDRSFVRQADAL